MRMRKLIGAFGLFALVTVWSLMAMAVAQWVFTSPSGWPAVIYYVIVGLGWVLPAMPLIRWMLRPDLPTMGDRSAPPTRR